MRRKLLPIFGTDLRLLALAGLVTSTAACTSAYRGAAVLSPGEVPRGQLIKTFARTSCTEDFTDPEPTFVDYVQGADGSPFIVERGRSDSWVVVTNSRLEGDTIVFQTIRRTDPAELREYRFPEHGAKPARFIRSKDYAKPRGSTHRFETQPRGTTATCTLIPVDPLTGAPITTYAEEGDASGPGWGFDGTSFKVGDRVLVDMGGRSVPAKVLQASGTAYFVRIEEDPDDVGRWIDPSTITGRLE
jgi:hypothetical protein